MSGLLRPTYGGKSGSPVPVVSSARTYGTPVTSTNTVMAPTYSTMSARLPSQPRTLFSSSSKHGTLTSSASQSQPTPISSMSSMMHPTAINSMPSVMYSAASPKYTTSTASTATYTKAPQMTYSSPVAYKASSPAHAYIAPTASSQAQAYMAPSVIHSSVMSPQTIYQAAPVVQAAEVHGLHEAAPVMTMQEAPPVLMPAGEFKVCVCGGAGGIGQPLSMLMALDENVSELCIFDLDIAMVPAAGVAADLGHLERKCKVSPYAIGKDDKPIDHLQECLTGCHLVLVPAGLPRKPGQDRKDLLNINAGIAKNIVEACAAYCPDAVIGLIVNPVNSVVPAMCEMWKKKGLDPRKICGVTTLDIVRANKFVHEITGQPMDSISIPVIGGHAGTTILPLFSQDAVAQTIAPEMIADLDKRVQDAGTEVVSKKNGKGSATLSMAYAGSRFGKAVLAGLRGIETNEYAYVNSEVMAESGVSYFSSMVTFGMGGPVEIHPIGDVTEYEHERLVELIPVLQDEIQAGLDYAAENDFA